MCESCFETEIYKFNSLSEFENFERELFLKDKNFCILESSKKTFLDFDVSYQCNKYLEIWYLAEPDNAWRGYFLKKDSAKIYIDEIKKFHLKKKYGYFLVLVILFLLTISLFLD
jgi:hypothetical protein